AGVVTHFGWGVPRWPMVRDMEKDFWDKVMQTNLGGTFLCTKHALPYMQERRSGHIINLYGGSPPKTLGSCVYSVSKDAIRTFTRFVAEEVREDNICVVSVSPGGAIATEDAPEAVRRIMPGPDSAGNRFIRGAETYYGTSTVFNFATIAWSSLKSSPTIFSISSPLTASMSRLPFFASARNSESFSVSAKAFRNVCTRSFGVPGGRK